MALKVSLFRKKVGQWGHVHLVNALKDAESSLHVIHEVTVRTVVENCEANEAVRSPIAFNWTLTEDFGASSDVLDEIWMYSLGRLYVVGERILQTIQGAFWEQGVEGAGEVSKRRARIVSADAGSDAVRATDESLDSGVEVDVPCELAGPAIGEAQGRLVGERGAVARYRITYSWEKCSAPRGSGNSRFEITE